MVKTRPGHFLELRKNLCAISGVKYLRMLLPSPALIVVHTINRRTSRKELLLLKIGGDSPARDTRPETSYDSPHGSATGSDTTFES